MLQVRKATLHDASDIANLITSLGYPTSTLEMGDRLRALDAHVDYATFVACEETRVLGVLGLVVALFYERSGLYARIVALSVAEHARGRGAGRALIRAAEVDARTRGATTVVVNSGVHRTSAHAFYENLGFAPTGKAFYKALTEDCPATATRPVSG